jgi:hypothetical protein
MRDARPSELLLLHSANLPFIRAQVVPHWQGWLVEGPADMCETDFSRLCIDQRVGSKTVSVSLLDKFSVRGTTAALNALDAKHRDFSTMWHADLDNDDTVPWRRVWAWTRAPYRDLKVVDHIWRLLHRSLSLGYNRRRFANDTTCCVCTDKLETYAHFTFECAVVHRLLAWFLGAWRSATGLLVPLTRRTALFASLPTTASRKKNPARTAVFSIAHGELLYTIWLGRCRAVMDQDLDAFSPAILAATAAFRIKRSLVMLASFPRQRKADVLLCSERLNAALTDLKVQDFK